jgi:hypothetical protein
MVINWHFLIARVRRRGLPFRSSPGSQPPHLASHPAAERWPTVATQRKQACCRTRNFSSGFSLRSRPEAHRNSAPHRRTAHSGSARSQPAPRARLKHVLRKVGTIALNGGMLGLIRLKKSGFLTKSSLLNKRIALAIGLLITFCSGLAAGFAWRSSKQVPSVPPAR